MLDKVEKVLTIIIKTITTILLLALTFLMTYTVVLRFVFNTGFPACEELVRYLFVWTAFFGIVLGVKEKSHMRLDILTEKIPGFRPYSKTVYYVGSYVFWGVVAVYGFRFAAQAAKAKATLIPITMNYIYSAVPVCAVLCIVYTSFQLIREFSGRRKEEKNV